ncbi:PAS domain S-box-containing protein/diguanylate cyclase (GGDEF) domain-containing protein [Halomonas shengliensis]|uniref:PAS domain S-box-containing protein/diguanylate cyclase (GGDEF) domain-containing protein n=1 Tax=Halomonas shengliensis TaxID=419597 RepID=A0A1H0MR22_9GAMM|nr:sensor domain-containing diguanylate cyclase [Halomonas shengliensis]SDO82784.1 PAS domain S-box-containing protein/diguanylate cyclase (GGDEF) domain-containing protein [Halomonas shengliensis]
MSPGDTARATRHIRRMHRHIRLLTALGILLTGLLAGLATALPFYLAARDDIETTHRLGAETKALALSHQLERYDDIARQLTSRSEIRQRLEQYALGELSLPALRRFTEPRLADALDEARDLRGLLRLGPQGETVARLGEVPEALGGEACPGTRVLEAPLRLLRCHPIHGGGRRLIGHDLLLFDSERLAALIGDGRRFGPNVRQHLVDLAGGRYLAVSEDGSRLVPVSELTDDGGQTVYRIPLEVPDWELAVAMPDTDILRAVREQLLWPLVAVGLLVLLGTAIISRALSPLLSRVARQAARLAETDEELRQAASVFRHAHEAIAITDAEQRLIDVNPAFSRLLGYAPEEVQGQPLLDLIAPQADTPERLAAGSDTLAHRDAWQGEVHYRRAGGGTLTALQTISVVRGEAGEMLRYIHIFNDITALKAAEAKVQHRALHDELTGLPNRLHLEQHLAQGLRLARREGHGLAVLFLDLDHFKEVNDRLGHAAGDDLLRAVTERLQGALREADLLARLGGDEFVAVLAPLRHGEAGAIAVATNLIDALAAPFSLRGEAITIGVSVGIALYPEDGEDAESLVEAADAAMYRAKAGGRNTWRHHAA